MHTEHSLINQNCQQNMETKPFIFIPQPVLRDFISSSETINDLYDLGIYFSSRKIACNEDAALKDFIYCVYRKQEIIPNDLYKECINIKNFPYDDQYWGFTYKNFDPFQEIAYLQVYGDRHSDFIKKIKEWYRFKQMYHLLDLKEDSLLETLENAKRLNRKYGLEGSSTIQILVNGQVMMKLYENRNKLTVDDRAIWAMYFGIISILGKKDFVQTTSDLIKCRMFGAKNKEELEQILVQSRVRKKLYDKFTTKYQYNKILNLLQDRGMIRELAHKRRTYLSFKARNVTELMDMIIEKEKGSAKKQRDEEKKKAIASYYETFKQVSKPESLPINLPSVSAEKTIPSIQHSSSDWDDLPF